MEPFDCVLGQHNCPDFLFPERPSILYANTKKSSLLPKFFRLTAELKCFADSFAAILIGFVSRYSQGVMRVRKRVTLMAVTVTVMFGVCWVSDIIAHTVDYYTSLNTSRETYAVIHTLILLNTAVNPFVYALINRNFREKLKETLCCSCTVSAGSFSPPAVVHQNSTEFANKTYQECSVLPSSRE